VVVQAAPELLTDSAALEFQEVLQYTLKDQQQSLIEHQAILLVVVVAAVAAKVMHIRRVRPAHNSHQAEEEEEAEVQRAQPILAESVVHRTADKELERRPVLEVALVLLELDQLAGQVQAVQEEL
jgi:hypothetical protein